MNGYISCILAVVGFKIDNCDKCTTNKSRPARLTEILVGRFLYYHVFIGLACSMYLVNAFCAMASMEEKKSHEKIMIYSTRFLPKTPSYYIN